MGQEDPPAGMESTSPLDQLPRRGDRGQGLVEFALVLPVLMLLLLAIVQFGFIFNSYVTLTNAAREGAREGSIYIYNGTLSKAQNDALRNGTILSSVKASMNLLGTTAPNFTNGSSWTSSNGGLTFTDGDLTITYAIPAGLPDSDPRTGQQVTVSAVYHQDILIPVISALLPHDSGGRLALTGQVTMVIN